MKLFGSTRDAAWLEHLVETYHQRLHAFATRRVGPDEADDVVGEVFTAAWRRRRDVPDDATTWLFQAARNHVLQHQRSHARRSNLHGALRLVRPQDDATAAAARVEIDSVLDQLHPTDAEVLRLTAWEQLTPSEIAEVLRITPGAARTRLMRARQRAQSLFRIADDEPEPAEGDRHAV